MYLCKTIEFYDIQESYSVMKWSKTQNLSESPFFRTPCSKENDLENFVIDYSIMSALRGCLHGNK